MHNFALIGPKGCGKDSLAGFFVEYYGYTRLAFADHLKFEVACALDMMDTFHEPTWTEKEIEKDKERFRTILQWWGTEFRRREDPDYWVKILAQRLDALKGKPVVVTDARFLNEINMLKDRDFELIRIRGSKNQSKDKHISEVEWKQFPFYHIISNNRNNIYFPIKRIAKVLELNSDLISKSNTENYHSKVRSKEAASALRVTAAVSASN